MCHKDNRNLLNNLVNGRAMDFPILRVPVLSDLLIMYFEVPMLLYSVVFNKEALAVSLKYKKLQSKCRNIALI